MLYRIYIKQYGRRRVRVYVRAGAPILYICAYALIIYIIYLSVLCNICCIGYTVRGLGEGLPEVLREQVRPELRRISQQVAAA
nr:MAG TPA: hypothetical protein [Caudoviricetes sp.]